MTEAQKNNLLGMMQRSFSIWGDEEATVEQESMAAQAYNSGLIALQLDRIATALEKPTPNYDPHVSTALNFMLRLSNRVSRGLCIYCGEREAILVVCSICKEQKKQERIAKYGYDYLEDEQA